MAGFTFVESMVVIAIVGIMVAVAAPWYNSYIAGQRMRDQMSAFSRAINLARTEAVKRGRNVMVCRSDAPEATTPTCGAHSGNWASGWLIFADDNGNRQHDATETVIQVQSAWANSGTITANGNPLVFRPSGIGVGIQQTITFKPKVAGVVPDKTVTLSVNGRWQ